MQKASNFFIVLTNTCNLKCKHCYDFKSNLNMTDSLLNKVEDYIIDSINNNQDENEFCINYVGGEITLYNQTRLITSIKKIKENCKNKVIRFLSQSNLSTDLSDTSIEFFKLLDEIGTSYDPLIRFTTYNQKIKWIENIRKIQSLNVPIRLTITLTKQCIETLNPEILLDFMLALNIKILEFNRYFPTLSDTIFTNVLPKNDKVRDWTYSLFIQYLKIKKVCDFSCVNLDCLIDSFEGNYNWEHGRTCTLDNETFSPNGDVSTCMLMQKKPIYNLLRNEKLNDKEDILKEEQNIPDLCKQCKYLKYCKGDCQRCIFDETGCTTAYKIYDYLEEMQKLKS